ncbi:MAG: response regulator [Lachnospiraceae bacterium]|nr:response regulator [Lachnospiraceae bacterium]
MIYRVLLAGNDKETIDGFFNELSDQYILATCSGRKADIDNHISFFGPELMIICLGGESEEELAVYSKIRRKIEKYRVSVAIIGYNKETENFQLASERLASLIIKKPASMQVIDGRIQDHMKEVDADNARRSANTVERREMKFRTPAPAPSAPVQRPQAPTPARPVAPSVQQAPSPQPSPAPQPASAPAAPQPGAAPAAQGEPAEKKRILAVDDEPLMLKLIQEQLSDMYDVSTAITGKLAFKFLEKKPVDLVLLDYEMPGESGAEVIEKLRSDPAYRSIPIVFLTGVTNPDKIRKIMGFRPQGYILKPVNREKMLEVITKIL